MFANCESLVECISSLTLPYCDTPTPRSRSLYVDCVSEQRSLREQGHDKWPRSFAGGGRASCWQCIAGGHRALQWRMA